jgi:hypothetical protein
MTERLQPYQRRMLYCGEDVERSIPGYEDAGYGEAHTQVEVDFGTTPLAEQTFTITDTWSRTDSIISAQTAWEAPTGKDLDELEMDTLVITPNANAGSYDLLVKSTDGSYLADTFKINVIRTN